MMEMFKVDGFENWRIPPKAQVSEVDSSDNHPEHEISPADMALMTYRQLKYREKCRVVIQPLRKDVPAFVCRLERLNISTTNVKGEKYKQLWLKIKDPMVHDNNGNVPEENLDTFLSPPKQGIYACNAADLDWVAEDYRPVVDELEHLIRDRADELLQKDNTESLAVYRYLQEELHKGDVTQNHVFQFMYRSYYRMDNAGLTDDFKSRYFQLLEELKSADALDLWSLDAELEEFPNRKGQISLQLSFITKLLSTVDSSMPVHDSHVATAFGFRPPHTKKERDERLETFDYQYDKIRAVYLKILEREYLQETIDRFSGKFPDFAAVSDMKKLDFLVWWAGRLGA